ncbi:hypothetical protein BURMUCF2_3391 [Burkholderia multivorans CF2]|nr:hypothetical protein BURMUCF2_3391 [Burkholderia multivorans CF2]
MRRVPAAPPLRIDSHPQSSTKPCAACTRSVFSPIRARHPGKRREGLRALR